jgi:ABC-type polysaccharide/polyol phosphate export permease
MIRQVEDLVRHRALVRSLVGRELKARYRGSVLGFVWSFVNPILLLFTYWLAFTYMFPGVRTPSIEPYFLFIFCGILPWTWFSASAAESAGVLIASGNLIKKVLFPAEVLPTVAVLANLVHFALGLPVLLLFLLLNGKLSATLALLPLVVLVQLLFTLGVSYLVAALTVHFRDIQSILGHVLHVWFFATPVLYEYQAMPDNLRRVLRFNPLTHVLVSYQEILFHGSFAHGRGLALGALASLAVLAAGFFLFERLRDTLAEEV